MRYVVIDANGKMTFRVGPAQFVEDALDHRRGEFLGGEPIATSNDMWLDR